MRKGDALVVWRLDRLGRTLCHLIEWINELEEQCIGFKRLHETIDTSSSSGKLVFHIFGALSEFECNLMRERTRAALNQREQEVGRVVDLRNSKKISNN